MGFIDDLRFQRDTANADAKRKEEQKKIIDKLTKDLDNISWNNEKYDKILERVVEVNSEPQEAEAVEEKKTLKGVLEDLHTKNEETVKIIENEFENAKKLRNYYKDARRMHRLSSQRMKNSGKDTKKEKEAKKNVVLNERRYRAEIHRLEQKLKQLERHHETKISNAQFNGPIEKADTPVPPEDDSTMEPEYGWMKESRTADKRSTDNEMRPKNTNTPTKSTTSSPPSKRSYGLWSGTPSTPSKSIRKPKTSKKSKRSSKTGNQRKRSGTQKKIVKTATRTNTNKTKTKTKSKTKKKALFGKTLGRKRSGTQKKIVKTATRANTNKTRAKTKLKTKKKDLRRKLVKTKYVPSQFRRSGVYLCWYNKHTRRHYRVKTTRKELVLYMTAQGGTYHRGKYVPPRSQPRTRFGTGITAVEAASRAAVQTSGITGLFGKLLGKISTCKQCSIELNEAEPEKQVMKLIGKSTLRKAAQKIDEIEKLLEPHSHSYILTLSKEALHEKQISLEMKEEYKKAVKLIRESSNEKQVSKILRLLSSSVSTEERPLNKTLVLYSIVSGNARNVRKVIELVKKASDNTASQKLVDIINKIREGKDITRTDLTDLVKELKKIKELQDPKLKKQFEDIEEDIKGFDDQTKLPGILRKIESLTETITPEIFKEKMMFLMGQTKKFEWWRKDLQHIIVTDSEIGKLIGKLENSAKDAHLQREHIIKTQGLHKRLGKLKDKKFGDDLAIAAIIEDKNERRK